MNLVGIPLYRLLPASLALSEQLLPAFRFSSSGPEPGARPLAPNEFSLGTDSDWSADSHDLIVHASLRGIAGLEVLFSDDGITGREGRLQLALEWTSADSGWRKVGVPAELCLEHCTANGVFPALSLILDAGAIRGTGRITLQVFLGDAGSQCDLPSGLATEPGFRFGALGLPVTVVVDGDGSLFPIFEEGLGEGGALWQFRQCWIDPYVDSFSSEYVSLVLNRDHPHFGHLRSKGDTGAQTPLMRQVLASWVAIFVGEIARDLDGAFSELVGGASTAEEGSIASIAASFVNYGNLDLSSAALLAASAQCWLDRRINESENPE